MKGKKLARRIEKDVRKQIEAGNEKIIAELRKEIGGRSGAGAPGMLRNAAERKDPHPVSTRVMEMVQILGEMGERESFPFASGVDALELVEIKRKLHEHEPITTQDDKKVFDILRRHAPSEAEAIERKGTAQAK